MKKQFQLLKRATFVSLLLGVLVVGVAYAITITVDGIRESAWDGVGAQTPGNQVDGDEAGITDNYDIERVQWTNDPTIIYFLVETRDDIDMNGGAGGRIYICMNTDNNTSTGFNFTGGICNNIQGADRRVLIDESTGTISVRSCTGAGCTTNISCPDCAYIYATTYLEASVNLSSLGMNSSALCDLTNPTVVYFDNGIVESEDATPNTNTFDLSCGSPTAVTLETLSVRNTNNMVAIGVAGVLLLGGALILLRSRKPTAE